MFYIIHRSIFMTFEWCWCSGIKGRWCKWADIPCCWSCVNIDVSTQSYVSFSRPCSAVGYVVDSMYSISWYWFFFTIHRPSRWWSFDADIAGWQSCYRVRWNWVASCLFCFVTSCFTWTTSKYHQMQLVNDLNLCLFYLWLRMPLAWSVFIVQFCYFIVSHFINVCDEHIWRFHFTNPYALYVLLIVNFVAFYGVITFLYT